MNFFYKNHITIHIIPIKLKQLKYSYIQIEIFNRICFD